MRTIMIRFLVRAFVMLLIPMLACNLPGAIATVPPTPEQVAQISVAGESATPQPAQSIDATHRMTPAEPKGGQTVYDVVSAGTASEKRAPYGDSYEWNRLERPFQQDMAYVSDLDVNNFTVTEDGDWWYVTVQLTGLDPDDPQHVHYGIELDLDRNGFGNYLIWAHSPYSDQWDTRTVQIYQDKNQDTSGFSALRSDAPVKADGYETLIFDGQTGGADPDLAWVRMNTSLPGTVQFAFKTSWAGSVFMIGVIADAGIQDPTKLDYVDRFTLAEAGSPVKENMYYPVKALFLVDNTCREAIGFEPTHYEPQGCPVEPTPTKEQREPKPESTPAPGDGCNPPNPGNCPYGWDPVHCECACSYCPFP